MKPKDLIIPCSFEQRKPMYFDRFLYVPKHYYKHDEYEFPGFDALFLKKQSIEIEFCSGNGQWIIEKAKANPNINYIAVEMQFDRVRKIFCKMHNEGLDNLFVVFGEAFTFSTFYLKENEVSSVYINFPDPWPKKKHAKYRLIRKEFLDELTRIIIKEGLSTVVTDDVDASLRMSDVFLSDSNWKSAYKDSFYVEDWPGYGSSYFDSLWRKQGLSIRYMQFQNIK